MPRVDPLLPSFNAGELSPRLHGRLDFTKYRAGLAECLNLIALPEGGVTRRPATRYVAEVEDSAVKGRVESFEATAEDNFILELCDTKIRFFYHQGQLSVDDTDAAISNGQFTSNITGWDDRSTGGAGNQISHDSTNGRLTLETNGSATDDIGWAEQDVTTSNTNQVHVIKFRVVGDPGDKIQFRVGSTSTGSEILSAVEREVGYHCVAFTPTASPFYVQFLNVGFNADKDIYIDDVSIIDDAPVEIDSPYVEADLFSIMGAQSNDVRYLFRDGVPPYKLLRYGNSSWSLVEVAWQDGPYLDTNTTATTLTPGATSGVAVTVTASSTTGINDNAGFASTDVGRLVRIDNGSAWGWGIIVGFTNTTTVSVHVKKAFAATSATATWRLGSWSDTTSWPRTGGFFEQRLYVAATSDFPQTLWASQTGDFENHKPDDDADTVEDDDAFSYTLSSDSVNEIHWLSAGEDVLVIGASGGEWVPKASGIVITPLDITIRRQTTHGSAATQPVRVDNVVLLLQKAKRKIREFVFAFESDSYQAPDLTRLAQHITTSGLVEMAYQQEPDSLVWVVRTDGVLPSMTYRRGEDVIGWSPHKIGGRFETSFAQVWQVDAATPTYVDETTDANDAGNADWNLFPSGMAIGDYAAFGFKQKFRQLTFDYANGTAGSHGTVTWEYWNGTEWHALDDVTDETTGFTATAADDLDVTWTEPDDWQPRTLNSSHELYYVRARVTALYDVDPIMDQGRVSGPTVVESVATIIGAADATQVQNSDDRNEVWMIVKRTIDGQTKRYIEVLEGYYDGAVHDQEDAYYADSIITYDGSSTTTITGLSHLEGERVKIWGDGAILPDEVVSGGEITVDSAVSVAQVGLPYKHRLKTLKVGDGNPAGTPVGKKKRIYSLTFVLLESFTLKYGPEDGKLTAKEFRVVADATDAGAPLFTGEKTFTNKGGWDADARIILESEDPAPFTLLAIAPNVDVNPLV